MTVIDLIVLQILAHLIADFIFQSEKWIENKREYGFHSSKLYIHALIVLIISYGLSFHTYFFLASIVIASSHLLLDGFKERIRKVIGKYTYIVDQIFHIGVILMVTYYFIDYSGIDPYLEYDIKTRHLLMLAGFIFCTKPANIFIKELMLFYEVTFKPDAKEHSTDLINAGRLIGITERILALILLFLGEFEAIGFIIAAKSILRYENTKSSKTEYVLIGTMLSFGIAILTYAVVIHMTNMLSPLK